MLLFNASPILVRNSNSPISIHLMLLFNQKYDTDIQVHFNFNTSNVTIQRDCNRQYKA